MSKVTINGTGERIYIAGPMTGKRIYIAGPMTGIDDFNRPAFFAAERYLKDRGAIVLNPATHPDGLTYHQYMDIDSAMIRSVEMIAFLPGYRNSKGAMAEYYWSKALGHTHLEIDFVDEFVVGVCFIEQGDK